MEAAPDGRVSLVEPDTRSRASQGKGTAINGVPKIAATEVR